MCLNVTYMMVRRGKHMSDVLSIQNGPNKEMLRYHCFHMCLKTRH
jgi:hypothetical protein